MRDKFIEFLKSEDAWEKFLEEYEKQNILTIDDFFKAQEQPSEYLFWAFVWNETKDGDDYWEELDSKWIEICKQ